MKHIVRLVSVLSLLIFIVPVGSSGSTLGENYVLFGINEYGYNYSESSPGYKPSSSTYYYSSPPPAILDREYGATSAFHLEAKLYSHDRAFPWYGGFQLEYGGGIQTYNGGPLDSMQFGVPGPGDTTQIIYPIVGPKSNTFLRMGGFVGPFFKVGECLVGLNAGILYYNWYRGVGYDESYTWIYLPLGAELQWNLNGRLSAGLDVQYRIMLSGSMQATYDFQTVIENNPMSANQFTLGTKDGFYLGIPIQLQIDREFGLEWKPWFELRPSGISGVVYASDGGEYLEPNSTSYSIGMSVSVMFGTFSSMAQPR